MMLPLFFVFLAGFVNGSFAMPSKWMNGWKEESIWLSFSLLGLFILPLLTMAIFIPDIKTLLNSLIQSSQLPTLAIGGLLFGMGQICLSRAFRLIGMGLNFAISISISTVCVALVELFMNYHLFATRYAFLQMAGITLFLLAVTMGTKAGFEKGKLFHLKSVTYGILLSIGAGIGSACQGIAYHLAGPMNGLSENIVAWAVVLFFGFIPYAAYFLTLSIKNRTYSTLVKSGTKKYWFFALTMGSYYWASLIIFSLTENKLSLTIAWPIFMIFIVLTSNFWSWISGEWRNTSMKAVRNMRISIGLFVGGLLIFSLNSGALEPPKKVQQTAFLEELEDLFSISSDNAKKMIGDFHEEMRAGLTDGKSSLNMVPAFIGLPQGNEMGEFIALDLGGTNFRVMLVDLDGKGHVKILSVKRYVIEKEVMQGSGDGLFDFIAIAIRDFMKESEISFDQAIKLGFTFSFPVKQENIASGTLLNWTKGFTAKGVVGQDVVKALNEALQRQGVDNLQVSALILDAVATLATESYSNPQCSMSVILGTGTDASYPEIIDNIKKINFGNRNEVMMVNLGWGNFDKIQRNIYDEILDSNSLNPGQQKFEKLVSGMYLGEILRLVTIDLIDKGLIFKDKDRKFFSESGSIKTEDLSLIEKDTSPNLDAVGAYLRTLGVLNSDLDERRCFQQLSSLISVRSARLSATLMSAVITWMDPQVSRRHVVGIDGSLFEKYHHYEKHQLSFLAELLGDRSSNVHLELVRDGSGIGAAIISAMTQSH